MDIQTALQETRTQWSNLESIYNQVTDPVVLDSIIHQMLVAEQTYDKLWARARAEQITVHDIPMRQ